MPATSVLTDLLHFLEDTFLMPVTGLPCSCGLVWGGEEV